MKLFGNDKKTGNALSFPRVVEKWSQDMEGGFEYDRHGKPSYLEDKKILSKFISLIDIYLLDGKGESESFDTYLDQDSEVQNVNDIMTAEINLGAAFGEAAASGRDLSKEELEKVLDELGDEISGYSHAVFSSESDVWDVELSDSKGMVYITGFYFNTGFFNHDLVASADEPVKIDDVHHPDYDEIYLWPGSQIEPEFRNMKNFNEWISYP